MRSTNPSTHSFKRRIPGIPLSASFVTNNWQAITRVSGKHPRFSASVLMRSLHVSAAQGRSTTRAERTATSWTACTNASCAPAAPHPAHLTGGTKTSTWALQSSCKPTGDWPFSRAPCYFLRSACGILQGRGLTKRGAGHFCI